AVDIRLLARVDRGVAERDVHVRDQLVDAHRPVEVAVADTRLCHRDAWRAPADIGAGEVIAEWRTRLARRRTALAAERAHEGAPALAAFVHVRAQLVHARAAREAGDVARLVG